MRIAGLLTISLLTTLPIQHGAAQASVPAADVIKGNEAYNRGIEALANRLPDLAVTRFREALAAAASPKDAKTIRLRLAEAQVRARFAHQALETLADATLKGDRTADFWRAQALAAQGRLREAVAALEPLTNDAKAPFHEEASLTRASLMLSLGDASGALSCLEPLAKGKSVFSARAHLDRAQIFYDSGETDNATRELDAITPVPEALRPNVELLQARLLLEKGEAAAAVARFSALRETPVGQSLRVHHSAILGLADALAAANEQEEGIDTLLGFIQDNPQSPLLEQAFSRLGALLPETPEASNPVIERLRQWSIAPKPLQYPAIPLINGASAAWPQPATEEPSDRAAFSLYYLARALRNSNITDGKRQAYHLLQRLRLEYPMHFLARRALLETGRWLLEDGRVDDSISALLGLERTAVDPRVRAEAAFLAGKAAYLTEHFDEAAVHFERAANELDEAAQETAVVNAGISRLREGKLGAISDLIDATEAREARASLELERALFLVDEGDDSAQVLLEEFLINHPSHPRLAEARLALAAATLDTNPPDIAAAKEQLDLLWEETGENPPGGSLALVTMRMHELQNDWVRVAEIARDFLKVAKTDPFIPHVRLKLGEALFQTNDLNEARLVLSKLASEATDPALAETAQFFAARSAALGGTSQAQEESLALFDAVITRKGKLAGLAHLEKARTQIDLQHLEEAERELAAWRKTLEPDDPFYVSAAALQFETLYAQGGSDPRAYQRALAVLDGLLADKQLPPEDTQRISYQRGMVLENLDRPEEAREAYYRVLETASQQSAPNWEWVENCGFRALALLEKAEQGEAAVAMAEKIASFGGPRANEAKERAEKLRLKYMIWDDAPRPQPQPKKVEIKDADDD